MWVMLLIPDENHLEVYRKEIEPNIRPNAALAFAHGFNIHFKRIEPRADLDVIMVAPKGPGHLVRSTYRKGQGVPTLIAVAQDATGNAHALALSYACANGGGRAAVIETTFREETETDLFRRAGRSLRRHDGADSGELRDFGRGGIRSRDGLFRVPARTETHCRSVI